MVGLMQLCLHAQNYTKNDTVPNYTLTFKNKKKEGKALLRSPKREYF